MNYDSFERDKKTRDAVAGNLEVIGEPAKNMPEQIKRGHPEIN